MCRYVLSRYGACIVATVDVTPPQLAPAPVGNLVLQVGGCGRGVVVRVGVRVRVRVRVRCL